MSYPSEAQIEKEMRRLESIHAGRRFFSTGIQGHKYRAQEIQFGDNLRDQAIKNLLKRRAKIREASQRKSFEKLNR
jgi:hypothetical protein